MCTLVALHRVHPAFPLVVAANRDEFTRRSASGPEVLVDAPRVVGGRDLAHHGTWLAVRHGGFFAGLTNQRTWSYPDASRASRGGLVVDAARLGSVDAVAAHLTALPPRVHNPFNLLFGDARELAVAYVRDEDPHVEVERLAPGLHVLTNDRMGSPWFPKARRAADLLDISAVAQMDLEGVFAALASVLADHAVPDAGPEPPAGSTMSAALARELQAVCVHTPGYGTVSATLLALSHEGVAAYRYAPGAPCTHAFEDRTELAGVGRR